MSAPDAPERFDAIVVGAGFAGLYMLHRLREEGLAVQLLEAGDGVGGTWHWNPSWYLGSNIPRRPHVFMLYAGNFRRRCEDVVAAGFTGFD